MNAMKTCYPVHMGEWAIAVAALIAISAAYVGWHLWRAPVGYEDETGFHYGTPDEPLEEPGGGQKAELEDEGDGYDPEKA
jgi:hypothetical protein